jgi:hypothetical protein
LVVNLTLWPPRFEVEDGARSFLLTELHSSVAGTRAKLDVLATSVTATVDQATETVLAALQAHKVDTAGVLANVSAQLTSAQEFGDATLKTEVVSMLSTLVANADATLKQQHCADGLRWDTANDRCAPQVVQLGAAKDLECTQGAHGAWQSAHSVHAWHDS